MPAKRGGGSGGGDSGGIPVTADPGTFSATASSSGTEIFPLRPGFLSELSIRVNGDLAGGNLTGGPVKIETWLRRVGMFRHLCRGVIQDEMSMKGSGQLPLVSGGDLVVKWTNPTGTAVIVRVDAFIDEEASGDSAPGWTDETLRPIGYLWSARRIATQNNGAGGGIVVRISVPSGVYATLISARHVSPASAGNIPAANIFDEDSVEHLRLSAMGAGAAREVNMPAPGTATSTNNNMATSEGLRFGPGMFLTFSDSAALQTETSTIAVTLLLSDAIAPTWDTTGSGGTVALAASTISDLNTWRAVYPP